MCKYIVRMAIDLIQSVIYRIPYSVILLAPSLLVLPTHLHNQLVTMLLLECFIAGQLSHSLKPQGLNVSVCMCEGERIMCVFDLLLASKRYDHKFLSSTSEGP